MQPEFWIRKWESNETGFHQDHINPHLTTWWPQLKLAQGARVLVPLCGKSLDMIWLWQQGYHVTGIELSPLAVQQFFQKQQITPTVHHQKHFIRYQTERLQILCGDIFRLEPDQLPAIDALYDRAALIALPEPLRYDYGQQMQQLLPDHADILLITLCYPQQQMPGPPFSVSPEAVTQYYGRMQVQQLAHHDILQDQPRFQERGLTQLSEHVLMLSKT